MADDLELLIDLHQHGARQGPGGAKQTQLAVALAQLQPSADLRIADIGCGTGASTLVLAETLSAHITAVDLAPAFLARLAAAAAQAGLSERITTLAASMQALPFAPGSFDAIWSEGAIYNVGFAAGVKAWRQFLKPNGILAVSELTWLTAERPVELQAFWSEAYPEVDTAAAKMAVLESLGFSPMGYFALPEHCWLDNYYRPLQSRFPEFLARHGHSHAAQALIEADEREILLYERYKDFVSYGYYIARYVGV